MGITSRAQAFFACAPLPAIPTSSATTNSTSKWKRATTPSPTTIFLRTRSTSVRTPERSSASARSRPTKITIASAFIPISKIASGPQPAICHSGLPELFCCAKSAGKTMNRERKTMKVRGSASSPSMFLVLATLLLAATAFAASSVYDFTLDSIDGKPAPLANYKGKILLLVNVASRCGFTPQYTALEATYEKYKDQGFVILGFPANNFGGQEPGTNEEIQKFCTGKYNVTFPVYGKVSVKGDDQTPLYSYLTTDANPSLTGDIKWNFTKFLVDRNGNVVQRFEPATKPDSPEVISAIEKTLKQ